MRVQWVDNRPDLELPFGKGNPSAFALTVRERVQRSVILADSVPLGGGKTARVAVRRDGDGVMFSQVVGDPGVDLGNPRIAALVDDAEARVRLASGLPE